MARYDAKGRAAAAACAHCNTIVDSRGTYVSTYCHKNHVHMAGFEDSPGFPCAKCGDWAMRNPGAAERQEGASTHARH